MPSQVNTGDHSYPHLTDEQFAELLGGGADVEGGEAHLLSCATCAAEFANLRESLTLFQQASVRHADRQSSQMRRPSSRVTPVYRPLSATLFWVAASAILMAGILPVEMRWQRPAKEMQPVAATSPARTTESESPSDETLLEDINRELSASIPTPMQALADPTGSGSQASVQITSTSTQRKD